MPGAVLGGDGDVMCEESTKVNCRSRKSFPAIETVVPLAKPAPTIVKVALVPLGTLIGLPEVGDPMPGRRGTSRPC